MSEIKGVNYRWLLIVAAAMVLFILAISGYSRLQKNRAEDSIRATRNAPLVHADQTRAALDRAGYYSEFETVINNCGACGTNSIIGGWETEDGRMMILSDNGTFTASVDDSYMIGQWKIDGNDLCLTLATGAVTCLAYEQKIDAMKLDDAIYIRQ